MNKSIHPTGGPPPVRQKYIILLLRQADPAAEKRLKKGGKT